MSTDNYISKVIKQVSKQSIGNDRVAFKRRIDNIEAFVRDRINPTEQQILSLREKLIPLYDQLKQLRAESVEHCTHPEEMLSIGEPEDGFVKVTCKFCEKTFHVDINESQ